MRTSHFIAILSLTTSLATAMVASPALAAFEFMSKAKPAAAKPAPTTASVPVTKTDTEITTSDLAKEPTVPVWTAKTAPTPVAIPLTPVVSASDSLEMIDGPLLPDEMDAPVAAPKMMPAKPVAAAPLALPPVDAKRQVLARSNETTDKTVITKSTTAVAPVSDAKRNAALWDKPPAPINASTDPVLAGMTTEKSAVAKPLAPIPAPAPLSNSGPLSLTAANDAKDAKTATPDTAPAADQASVTGLADMNKTIEVANDEALSTPTPMTHAVPVTPAPIVETIMDPMPAAAPADDAVVEGFGSNLPLAIALRQIVPPTYRFSFGTGVDAGQRVSWQGGKKWSQIVADMAAKNGLSTEIAGNVIAIRKNSGMSNAMEDVVMGATAAPMPSPLPPIKPVGQDLPPPIKLAASAMPAKPLASTSATSSSTMTRNEQTSVLNKAIDIDDITDVPATAKTPAVPVVIAPAQDKKDLLLPPPAQPLQNNLQDTKDTQAIVTADKPETKPIAGASLTTPGEWVAHSGQSLRAVLQDWSHQANVSLVWSSDFDYPLQTDIRIQGTYPDAVRTLLAGFGKAQPKPLGRLHNNTGVGAQPVLIIDTPRLLKE